MPNNCLILMEDDALLRKYYCLGLESSGFDVVQAENSRDIVDLIDKHRPALIITDLVMPDHEGIEGIFKIIEHHSLPIVAVSGYQKFLDIAEKLVTATLLKPVKNDVLVKVVNDILAKSNADSAYL